MLPVGSRPISRTAAVPTNRQRNRSSFLSIIIRLGISPGLRSLRAGMEREPRLASQ
jgi:hypothetical protein